MGIRFRQTGGRDGFAFAFRFLLREFEVQGQEEGEDVFVLHSSSELARIIPLAHVSLMLTGERTSPEQIVALRAMTGARRLRLAEQLYWSARKMKAAGLRHRHPDWPEQRLQDEVRRIFSHART